MLGKISGRRSTYFKPNGRRSAGNLLHGALSGWQLQFQFVGVLLECNGRSWKHAGDRLQQVTHHSPKISSLGMPVSPFFQFRVQHSLAKLLISLLHEDKFRFWRVAR